MRLQIRRNGNQIVAFKSKLMAAKLKEATELRIQVLSRPRINQKPNKPHSQQEASRRRGATAAASWQQA